VSVCVYLYEVFVNECIDLTGLLLVSPDPLGFWICRCDMSVIFQYYLGLVDCGGVAGEGRTSVLMLKCVSGACFLSAALLVKFCPLGGCPLGSFLPRTPKLSSSSSSSRFPSILLSRERERSR
jgi:hypothetical protein